MLGCCVFRNQMVAQGFKEEPVSGEEKLKVLDSTLKGCGLGGSRIEILR